MEPYGILYGDSRIRSQLDAQRVKRIHAEVSQRSRSKILGLGFRVWGVRLRVQGCQGLGFKF